MTIAVTTLRQGANNVASAFQTRVGRRLTLVPSGTRGVLAAVVLLVVIAAGAVTRVELARAQALPANAALKVGDVVVTKQDLQHRIELLGALYGVQQPQGGSQADRFRRDAAKSIAVSMILVDEARKHGIVIADKVAQDDLNTLVQEEFPQGRDAFVQALSAKGASEQDVLTELKRQIAGSRLFNELTKNVPPVTNADVSAAIARRDPLTLSPEKRHVRNIVVATEEQASKLLARARAGADFAALAKSSSLDQSTSGNGGDLGTVSADQLDGVYAKPAFAAAQGAYFGPVKTRFGWNVGQVLTVQSARQLPADQIKTALANQRKLTSWRASLARIIKAAHVRYAAAYRPADPDAPPPMTP